MLASRKSGGIIFTTIQKFSLEGAEDDHPVLCERTNVVVISDEAHRSQYGTKGRLDTKTGKYVYGYAKHMRDALPGASFIGFTGTPIEKADANTQETFGGYVSIYDIEDAKEDKAKVPIYYESRLAKLDINREPASPIGYAGPRCVLEKDVEEVIEDEEGLRLEARRIQHGLRRDAAATLRKTCGGWRKRTWRWSCWNGCCKGRSRRRRGRMEWGHSCPHFGVSAAEEMTGVSLLLM